MRGVSEKLGLEYYPEDAYKQIDKALIGSGIIQEGYHREYHDVLVTRNGKSQFVYFDLIFMRATTRPDWEMGTPASM